MPMPLLAVVVTAFSCMTNEVASGAVAAMRCSTLRMRSTGWFLATMKRKDSGSRRAISAVKTSGVVPPSTRTLRQPHCGIIQAARKPPKAAPNGKPQNMALVSVARRPSGQYSLIKVTALGMAAPSPTPVMKRQTTSWSRLPANADMRQATPMISTEVSIVIQRKSLNSAIAALPPNRPDPLAFIPPNGICASS